MIRDRWLSLQFDLSSTQALPPGSGRGWAQFQSLRLGPRFEPCSQAHAMTLYFREGVCALDWLCGKSQLPAWPPQSHLQNPGRVLQEAFLGFSLAPQKSAGNWGCTGATLGKACLCSKIFIHSNLHTPAYEAGLGPCPFDSSWGLRGQKAPGE